MDIKINKQKKATKKKLSHVLGAVALVALCAFAYYQFSPALYGVQQSDLWISEVKKGNFTRKVRGVGVLAASEIRWIAASSAGRVERILVKPGAYVTPDTIISELSNPDLQSQLEQAKWDLDAAKANLLALEAQMQEQTLEQELLVTQAKMALESAQLQQQAEQKLADQNIISGLEFATTKLQTKQSKALLEIRLKTQNQRAQLITARLEAERAQVRKFQNMVDHFQSRTEGLQIRADIEGILQQISVDVGQRVQVGGNIARVAKPNSLIAELQVQENIVQELKRGLSVSIDTRFGLVDGVVTRIDPRVIEGNVQVDVELTGTLPEGARPDLSITGTIVVEQIEDALYIDRPAGVSALSSAELYALDTNNQTAKIRTVKLGKASVSSIQILAGVNLGDRVVVSDTTDFQQHNAIKILQ